MGFTIMATKVWTILRNLRVLESNTLFRSIDCESVHLSKSGQTEPPQPYRTFLPGTCR